MEIRMPAKADSTARNPRLWWFALRRPKLRWPKWRGMLLFAGIVCAAQAGPPAGFWDYMIEFADDDANVFDPTDYALMINLPDKQTLNMPDAGTNKSIDTTPLHTLHNGGEDVEETP